MEIKLSTGKVIELTAEELRELLGTAELKHTPKITWIPHVEPPWPWSEPEITCGWTDGR